MTRTAEHLTADPRIHSQLSGYIETLARRARRLGAIENWHGWTADMLAAGLAGHGPHIGPSDTAELVLNFVMDPDELERPEMWGSALGRALAFWGTGLPSSVSRACAAAALGFSRANVHLMVGKGQLSEDPTSTCYPPRITTASLAHAMRQRHPLGG